jgi:hypothetical protein
MPPQVDIKSRLLRMNLDDSYYDLGKEDYVDALNITHDAQQQSQDIISTNITGNRFVPYNKPAGTNVTIGAKADVVRGRVFEFIWNSQDYHSIVIFDAATRTRTKLIENITDTNGDDVLEFERDKKIIHVDIIYRDEDEGDLLFWTDGNVSPRKINVKHIQDGDYTYIKTPFIELAKQPPRVPVQCVYGSDTTRNANSLRKKLVMATYRWAYDDFEKSTFTTYSKIPLPIGYYGSDNDIDNTNNNFITFTIETGDENVTDIEIAVRFSLAGEDGTSSWQDFILAISLNKEQLNIPDNSTYDYLFYNDSIYPPLDVEEVIQLFDYVPLKAKSQCAPNGNVIAFGAITEGYDNYPISELDVTITSENVTNSPPDTDPPSITYIQVAQEFTFTVNGSVPEGTNYKIYIFFNGTPPTQTFGVRLVAEYTSVGGDTTSTVASNLYNDMNSFSATPPLVTSGPFVNSWNVNFGSAGSYVFSVQTVPGSPSSGSISTEKTWLWDANYIYGLAYKDDQGRIMGGIATFVNPTDSDNDFMVTTPSFSLDGANVQTPVVYSEINHLPPEGAVTYAWVRRRMTYADFLFYMTSDFQDDPDGDGSLYFCLSNIERYKAANSQFIYETAPITNESRIKIVAGIASDAYNGDIYNQDYEILGVVDRTPTGGSSPTDDVPFIKVKKPTDSISPAYSVNMLVMVYTPMENPTDIADSVYWEWGEEYAIYEDAGVNYHRGGDQDQTASQPATFSWEEGDVYFHDRTMYESTIASATSTDTVALMDANWSDFFASAVNDNGRGLTIDPNARQTYFPATIRFSREYQQNTNINQTNRFVYLNFMDLDRSFMDIFKMSIKDRYIRVGQKFKIGIVPIFNQISKDSANSTLIASTDQLLNPVQYYNGDYGVGKEFPVWVDYNYSSYFFDTNRGIWCRLSQDGIIPISIQNKINSWATEHGIDRQMYGVFDPKSNNCIFTFEAADTDPAYTIAFDEDNNAFEGFLSYHPEMMCALGALLITYKNGDTWTHDADYYNRFYGVKYPSTITPVFNGSTPVKKKYLGIGYKSLNNVVWESPTNGDIATSTVNPQTGLQQQSNIKEADYELEETTLCAALNYDANSMEDTRLAVVSGDYLGGNYIVVKLICPAESAQDLVNISQPYITWIGSNRNF